MRPIDADALPITPIDATDLPADRCLHVVLLQDIVDAPTIDAVEVVRCKDCIYYHPSFCKIWSKYGTVQTRELGYCYMGERREDGE